MESKTNYTLVGLAVLLLLIGLITAAIWLSIGFDKKKYDMYVVYIKESVAGLSDDSQVKFNGVKVGFVKEIELNPFDPQKVKILLNIEQGTPITISTTATLFTQGITGATTLGLTANTASLIPLQKTPGEEYPVIPTKPSFLNELEQTIKDVGKNINEVSKDFKQVFNAENTKNISKTLANLQEVTEAFAQNSKNIKNSLNELPGIVNNLKSGIKNFNNMATSIADAGKSTAETMTSGKSTIKKISDQAVPSVIILLRRLDLIAANLEKVTNQMRQNPSVVLRGTKPPKPGPGE